MAAHDSKARTQQPLVASATHSTDIQVPPSGSTTGIRLAPTSKPIPARPPATPAKLRFSPERLASEIARLDKGLAAILLLLAFLLASFVVKNTDVWMHLASGRDIVASLKDGKIPALGSAPFGSTGSQGSFVYHPWLYDVLLYGISATLGGPESPATGVVLVVLKALLVTALAGVLLSIRRPGERLLTPVLCVGLAVLALSPRLSLTPTCLSFVFLGVTLYLLQQPGSIAGIRGAGTAARLWLLPVLFVLWVNVDRWFFVGLLVVALYLLGEALQQALAPIRTGEDAPTRGWLGRVGLVFLVSVGACLINPYHYRAFALPPGLLPSALDKTLESDVLLQPLLRSPLNKDYLQISSGLNVTGLAYYALVAVGLVSFAANLGGWRWWRALIWLVFCILSLYQTRLIPFFAIVAGPIAALNFQDWARLKGWQLEANPDQARRALLGRGLSLVVGIGLVLAAWPGWLGANFAEPTLARRVGWGLALDPSLKQATEWLHAQHEAGRIPANARGFSFTPAAGDYCRWFCPEEKGLFDSRALMFPEAAKDFLDLRRAFRLEMEKNADKTEPPWQQVLREHGIHHVVMWQPFGIELHELTTKWMTNQKQWVPLFLHGRAVILGWQDPKRSAADDAFAALRIDLERRAFAPEPKPEDRAPLEGPSRLAETTNPWRQYLTGPEPAAPDEFVSRMFIVYFEMSRRVRQSEMTNAWVRSIVASTVGLADHAPGLLGMVGTSVARDDPQSSPPVFSIRYIGMLLPAFLSSQDQGPPAVPLLAIRAARRAIKANPDDAGAHLALAQATTQLWLAQEDHWATISPRTQLSPRQHLRALQVITAAQQALRVEPKAVEAHKVLYESFRKMNFWDLATEHMRAVVDLTRAAGPLQNEDVQSFRQRLQQLEDELRGTEKEYHDRADVFELQAKDKLLMQKVQDALNPQYGLARPALKLLLESDISTFGSDGAEIELRLLMLVGRMEEALEMLKEKDPNRPDVPAALALLDPGKYYFLLTLAEAATGHYAEAGKALDYLIGGLERRNVNDAIDTMRFHTFSGMGPSLLVQWLMESPAHSREIAEYHVMRGLLALEAGDNQTAAKHFRSAIGPGDPAGPQTSPLAFEGRPIAVRYLKELNKHRLD